MSIKAILKEFKIPLRRIPRYLIQGKKLLTKRKNEMELVEGLEKVLEKLKKNGHDLQIVSSNSAPIIISFLRRHKIEKYFSSVHGNVGIFNKAHALRKITKKQSKDMQDCVYVGDEVRDIEAAKKIGLDVVAVTWGFNGKKILEHHKPTSLADTPRELLRELKKV